MPRRTDIASIILGSFVLVAGCADPNDNTGDVAKLCGVSVAEVEQATVQAKRLRPNQKKLLGTCDVLIDDSGTLSIGPVQEQRDGR